jgi:alpha-beta hydrolase superfamily lysophospholipase
MINQDTFYGFKGRELFYRSVEPDNAKAVVLILHGYGEHSGRYEHVLDAFESRGYAAYAPDHRGHGRSQKVFGDLEGRKKIREDVRILTQIAKQNYPGIPCVLLGHSMGGMLALFQLLAYQGDYDVAILSAPAILLPDGVSPLVKALAGGIAAVAPNLPIQELDLSEATRNMEMRAQDDQDPLQYRGKARARTGHETIRAQEEIQAGLGSITLPLLVMHGTEDKVINQEASEMVYRSIKSQDKTRKIWDGLYHEIMNEPEREEVFKYLFAWLEERLL